MRQRLASLLSELWKGSARGVPSSFRTEVQDSMRPCLPPGQAHWATGLARPCGREDVFETVGGKDRRINCLRNEDICILFGASVSYVVFHCQLVDVYVYSKPHVFTRSEQ